MEKYRHLEYRAGRTVEVIETYPSRMGLRMTRERYNGRTPESMKRYNEKLQERKLTRLINMNFSPNDWFITLHYTRAERPNPETAAQQLTVFLRRLKRLYKKNSAELKYIKTTAYGSKGGIHHHLIINNAGINTEEITALWQYSIRTPDYTPLYENGEYSALANYFVKQSRNYSTEMIKGRRFSGSRNLKQPEIIKDKYIEKIAWKEPPQPKSGYIIDLDSVDAGINEYNGKPYLFYRMIKQSDKQSKEYNKRQRAENRKNVREQWLKLSPYGDIIKRLQKTIDSIEAEEYPEE